LLVLSLGLMPQPTDAADQAREPTTEPASAKSETSSIVEFKGLVQVRASSTATWRKPEIGETMPPGSEIRVGPRSSITFRFEKPEKLATFDRLGVSRISRQGSKLGTLHNSDIPFMIHGCPLSIIPWDPPTTRPSGNTTDSILERLWRAIAF